MIMIKHQIIITLLLLSIRTISLYAQSEDVRLVVLGEGKNKAEATATAMRAAVEQAYGAFVSYNTTILNDETIRDI